MVVRYEVKMCCIRSHQLAEISACSLLSAVIFSTGYCSSTLHFHSDSLTLVRYTCLISHSLAFFINGGAMLIYCLVGAR